MGFMGCKGLSTWLTQESMCRWASCAVGWSSDWRHSDVAHLRLEVVELLLDHPDEVGDIADDPCLVLKLGFTSWGFWLWSARCGVVFLMAVLSREHQAAPSVLAAHGLPQRAVLLAHVPHELLQERDGLGEVLLWLL